MDTMPSRKSRDCGNWLHPVAVQCSYIKEGVKASFGWPALASRQIVLILGIRRRGEMMKVNLQTRPDIPAGRRDVEVVERKGLGHPDTICDAVAEELSRRLCRFYLENFDHIAHHNVDKALLWGGAARPAFGGGEVLKPMEIFLAGRATLEFRGVTVPIEEIVDACVRDWFDEHMHAVDPDRHLRVHCLIRPGSSELVDLFARQREHGVAFANDTSCGVGFAPWSELERVVYDLERELNSGRVKRDHPEIGEDIKVMGVRNGNQIDLTVAIAMIDGHITDLAGYQAKKAGLTELAAKFAAQHTGTPVSVAVNTGDNIEKGDIYLTVTGTSAEAGDDGEVGRGNRANGLITPFRPMTLEAAAGKNPISHVGKLYNLPAGRIAAAIAAEVDGVEYAQCCLVSRIGRPITEPQIAAIDLRMAGDTPAAAIRTDAEDIVRVHVSRIGSLWRDTLDGTVGIY